MCGFAGVMSGNNSMVSADLVARMTDAIQHRGPDASGFWSDLSCGIALGHRRLSVIDLSTAGHQPMMSDSGRYIIVFNGEIYNHHDIRASLDGNVWVGNSDTEVFLVAVQSWGISAAVERCIGMFAFAIWDVNARELTLGRDRMGEKPLYYGWQGYGNAACFLFGSELKAIKAHCSFQGEIDRDSLRLFMRYGYIAAPYSIYKNIYKLSPGHLLRVPFGSCSVIQEPYWSLSDTAVKGVGNQLEGSSQDISADLEVLLRSAVSQQMLADVPVGAFLSGGVDSSTVVALMQAHSSKPVNTFTVGFEENGYNEALHAKAVAKYLGTDHSELYVSSRQALEVIPKLPSMYCEPFADSSQIPTFLLSKLARQEVTVSLSGDGGDELFGGYNRYILTKRFWEKISRLPIGFRSVIASTISGVPPSALDKGADLIENLLNRPRMLSQIGDKLHKGARALAVAGTDELHLSLLTHWHPNDIVLGGLEPKLQIGSELPDLSNLSNIERMMVLDAVTYLPDDILVKVDRAAMSVSLESRMPFLDHRVVEFAWRIPEDMKLQGKVGKTILREVLYKHVPENLIERPKMGFAIPVDTWLRGPLRHWCENLLDEKRLRCEGFLNPEPIRKKWAEHLSGKKNWQQPLWNVLMFQAWLASES